MDKSGQKITLCKIQFNLSACKKQSKNEICSFSDTARDFFYFFQAFGMRLNLKSSVNILDSSRHNTKSRFKHMRNISTTFL